MGPGRVRVGRIIPARAGFTRRACAGSCGLRGSSPLARGLQARFDGLMAVDRIIPARAGFTRRRSSPSHRGPDHPRSRGVYDKREWSSSIGRGSSPLARGLQHVIGLGEFIDRIIPARAGFTFPGRETHARIPDHPRSRGVYVSCCCYVGQCVWIIPARAGFTLTALSAGGGGGDHPRSRGVYLGLKTEAWGLPGSSPLARGLPSPLAAPVLKGGIIPARAGFTRRSRSRLGKAADHPRSRGVYWRDTEDAPLLEGSSPLARGLPRLPAQPRGRIGIIPARAGFTSRPAWT